MLEKFNETAPTTYEHWIDLGRVIIPCLKGLPIVKDWSNPNFKITKEEWKQKYSKCEIALRLDQDIDFDIDNELTKRFIKTYVHNSGSRFGRDTNPSSHYIWKGKLDFIQFVLPAELKDYCTNSDHGTTLCEIRTGGKRYTIVPASLHSKDPEYVRWEKYTGIKEYPGNLNNDLRKVAFSTALSILYPAQGQRDPYCTAIAGALLKHTDWSEEEINECVYNIALASNDEEADKRRSKGSSGKNATRKFGMPKLAEIIGCSPRAIGELFSWVGVEYTGGKEVAEESIGDIIEYGQDRYILKVTGKLEGQLVVKDIIVDGPTLMNQKSFYDAVISQASVWVPKMKPTDFENIMRAKYENRIKSQDYVEEAHEDLKFIKHFNNYIKQVKAYTDKKELAYYSLPYFNQPKKSLEFNLDNFEDYLESKKVNLNRVDLVLKLQRVLKAKKNRGKYKEKSCVSWKIENAELDKDDMIIEGEAKEITNES